MAVTGKFIGDFSSFTDAVKKAIVSLDGLEVNSRKVESALQRMTTQLPGHQAHSGRAARDRSRQEHRRRDRAHRIRAEEAQHPTH